MKCSAINAPPSPILYSDLFHHSGNRASINIEQFGNLGLTLRAKSNHFYGFGLLRRGELVAATTDL
jgi:hypothetical protein